MKVITKKKHYIFYSFILLFFYVIFFIEILTLVFVYNISDRYPKVTFCQPQIFLDWGEPHGLKIPRNFLN